MGGDSTAGSVTERVSDALRQRSERVQRALGSPLRTTRMAVVIGRLLGGAFVICFFTGLYSHLLQDPLPWLPLPARPVHLYAWNQGGHVVVGTMLIPLLLAKLWTVFPKLFTWPPVHGILHLLERISVAVLVATALMQPVTGLLDALQWYPWGFSFRRTHFALAWVLLGAMAVHIAVHLPTITRVWRADAGEADAERSDDADTVSGQEARDER
ncbi:cytochrome b/b6 domain-containing protein [Microbacterium sp. SD291]|uniref:cytochrome b/b6 domain-containing protein n=1 Tax=Microbacterium sp. SD291 TaxID=2782007 RepID=UPI001F6137B8|nr:cytochrome b/b6 domain-containing protein [Microbacterium sp. SD291]